MYHLSYHLGEDKKALYPWNATPILIEEGENP